MFTVDVQGGGKCVLQYEREADSVDIWHTEVPPRARGQGVARLLVEAAMKWIEENNLTYKLSCSYVQSVVNRN